MLKFNHRANFGGGSPLKALNINCFSVIGKFNLKKIGFTLAEVLITLGIIGIVAAITIPGLITNYQKRVTVTRLKGSYSKLMQAFKAAEDDYGPVTEWELSATDASSDFWGVYEKVISEMVKQRIVPFAKVIGDCGLNCPQRKKIKICRLNGVDCYYGQPSGYYTIYLADGTSWEFMIDNNAGILSIVKVYIDINGDGKPNVFGKDIFTIRLDQGTSLYGASSKFKRENLLKNCRECCSKTAGNYSGDFCGGLIQRDGWVISGDYPW